ncbi:uncharacterized protein PV07_06684 [Cladophialophora immunda]|uniref:Uncharacterized protein n=1 Tax=Cladophialophora immunda TaxID=569365 RepID=A0A0D1ZG95_9EURO|nr:uncharacterized protein PV07_06684 [Cladophialophora immunda]KIW26891.1 hypothetical protein PV07_06684 [Cladophialophora immunda]
MHTACRSSLRDEIGAIATSGRLGSRCMTRRLLLGTDVGRNQKSHNVLTSGALNTKGACAHGKQTWLQRPYDRSGVGDFQCIHLSQAHHSHFTAIADSSPDLWVDVIFVAIRLASKARLDNASRSMDVRYTNRHIKRRDGKAWRRQTNALGLFTQHCWTTAFGYGFIIGTISKPE